MIQNKMFNYCTAVRNWAEALDDHSSTHCVFLNYAKALDSETASLNWCSTFLIRYLGVFLKSFS